MNILACPICGTIFEETFINNMYTPTNKCPVRNCQGKLRQFDKNTFEIAHVLEQKGYYLISIDIPGSFENTHHIKLKFKDNYSFLELPKGFEKISYKPKDDIYPIDIVKYLDVSMSKTELYKQLAQSCIDLIEWAENL